MYVMNKKYKLVLLSCLIFLFAFGSGWGNELQLPSSALNLPIEPYTVNLLSGDETDSDKSSAPFKPKSTIKATILSILVPGTGQMYLGETGRGEVLLGVEVVSWIGFGVFRHAGSWKKDAYINYSVIHAGVDPNNKDDEFYKNVSFYDTRELYNESGRIINPSGPYYSDDPTYDWAWDNTTNRESFRDMRNDSKSDYRKANFMIGVAVFNRILAVIDTIRISRQQKGRAGQYGSIDNEKLKLDFTANPSWNNPKVGLALVKTF